MTQQGVNLWTLPQKNNINNAQDRLVVLFGASTANTSNSIAQTATISVENLFQNSSLSVLISDLTVGDITANAIVTQTIQANSYDTFFGRPLITVSFNLTANQIANCNLAPVSIVASQGPNTCIVPIWVYAISTIGTPWTATQAGFFIPDATGALVDDGTLQAVVAASEEFSVSSCLLTGPLANTVNKPVVFTSTVSNPTGGNTSVSGKLQYIVLENMPT